MSPNFIHKVGFYLPVPNAIYSMAIEPKENKLAVARSNTSIEIWNLSYTPYIEKSIPSTVRKNYSIEGLCWYKQRLFGVSLQGYLLEFDLYKLCIRNQWIITGGAATCLDINKSKNSICIGSEQGYINIFSIESDEIHFEKHLDKQEGRIISIKFNPSGDFLVTGCLNAIRIWNVENGHAIHRMQMGKSENKADTIVWCLEVLSDFTIFSGDSRGILTLWDGKLGAQIESHQSHKADIVALSLSEEEDIIYCAGVDPLIIKYQKVKVGQSFKWVKSRQRKIHEHDVRSLIYHRGKLYSGGIDSFLACSYHPPKTLLKYGPFLQSCVEVASKARLILLKYPNYVELWNLGEIRRTNDENYLGKVPLKNRLCKLVALQVVEKNKWTKSTDKEGILCASISSNGEWILLGTNLGFNLYRFHMEDNSPKITKYEDLDDRKQPCVQAAFNNVHNHLILALNDGHIIVYDFEGNEPGVSERLAPQKDYLTDTITFLQVSTCGKYLVAADPHSNIVIWKYNRMYEEIGYHFHCKLPKYSVPPTAMAINSNTICLVVTYADGKVIEYDIRQERYSKYTSVIEYELQKLKFRNRSNAIRSVVFDDRRNDIIMLQDDTNIIVIKKSETLNQHSDDNKRPRLVNGDVPQQCSVEAYAIQKYKYLLHLCNLSSDEMIAVEVNPLELMKKLPPAIVMSTFGSK